MGEEPDSRERIMEATHEALTRTGYADLTMSNIADASGTSTALLHYHYDTKEDLLVAFLDHLIEELEADLADALDEEPSVGLRRIVDWYVLEDRDERQAFHVALLELRSQAPYNERYRERLQRADGLIRRAVADIVANGMQPEAAERTDPEAVAALILATMHGARSRGLTIGEPAYTSAVRATLLEHVLVDLFGPEIRDRWDEIEPAP